MLSSKILKVYFESREKFEFRREREEDSYIDSDSASPASVHFTIAYAVSFSANQSSRSALQDLEACHDD